MNREGKPVVPFHGVPLHKECSRLARADGICKLVNDVIESRPGLH